MLLVMAAGRGVTGLWWPFSSGEGEKEGNKEPAEAAVATRVGFEMATAEQKFLAEAQKYLDLPPLEACQYQVGPLPLSLSISPCCYLSIWPGGSGVEAVLWGDGRGGARENGGGSPQLSESGRKQTYLLLHF